MVNLHISDLQGGPQHNGPSPKYAIASELQYPTTQEVSFVLFKI